MAADEALGLPKDSPYFHPEFLFTVHNVDFPEKFLIRPESIYVGDHWSPQQIVERRMEVLIELVCRLYQFAGIRLFWVAIARTWLETPYASNINITRMRALIAVYRQARIRYRKAYLKKHGKAAEGVTGLAKAMDWWIDRVGADFNAEARLKSSYTDKKSAVRGLESLLSHYHTKIAQRPLIVFHHPCWMPAYRSWKQSPELKGYPLVWCLSKDQQIPPITKKSLTFLGRMDKDEGGSWEQKKEKYIAHLKDYFMAEHTDHA